VKPVVIIVIVLILVFVSGYLMSYYFNKSSKSMDIELARLDSEVRTNKWIPASQVLEIMENKWKGMKSTWELLIDHQEIDNIDLSVSKMKEYVKGKDRVNALAEISSLKLLFEHIPKKDSLSLTNIL